MTSSEIPVQTTVNPHPWSGRGTTALWAFIILVAAIRLGAVFFVPFGQKVEHRLQGLNDEPAHFNYVKYLARHRSFPVLEHWVLEPDAFARNEFEYHQAPLYYLLCAPFCGISGGRGALLACRFVSFFFGIAGLWVIALILRDCGFGVRAQQAAVLFFGLLPSHLYFTVLASNDALSWLIALLLTRALLRYGTLSKGQTGFADTAVMTTVCLAAGALTKSSLLIMFPAAAGVFFYKYCITGDRLHLLRGALTIGIAGIAALPWYARNVLLYHSLSGMPPAPEHFLSTVQGLYGLLKGTDKYFWFPMQHLEGGTPAFFIVCAAGAVILAAHMTAAARFCVKERRGFSVAALLLFFLLNVVAYAWYFDSWGNPESRFLFPALGSIAYFFIVPAYKLFIRLNLERFFLPYILVVSLFPYPFLYFTG
jgi:hypothetical protein